MLVAAVTRAAALGFDTHAWQLAWPLADFLDRRGMRHEHLAVQTTAPAAARLGGDRIGQACALNVAGWFHAQLGDQEQALEHCRQALDLHRRLGDVLGQANACDSLGHACHRLARHEEAASWYGRAVELFREAGDRYHQADTLTRLGETLHAAALPDAAAWRQALTLLEAFDRPPPPKSEPG
ncbi:tetratricopeptide repeat protein [Nonomuraea sp. NPDC005692]|uniref:tetratricopeptide repeat protein n=1 Tax=Nonomuraea sp. NPDC005692 TaxID=3157168 RepID=UPI0033DE1F75